MMTICAFCSKELKSNDKIFPYQVMYPLNETLFLHAHCFEETSCLYSIIYYLHTQNPNFISPEYPDCHLSTTIHQLIQFFYQKNPLLNAQTDPNLTPDLPKGIQDNSD